LAARHGFVPLRMQLGWDVTAPGDPVAGTI
jgi:hypothetical protein